MGIAGGSWFDFLVPLTYWKQLREKLEALGFVVICFLFSTFDVLETTGGRETRFASQL